MSVLTTAWSMCAAASLMLDLMQLFFWLVGGRALVYLLASMMAFPAGAEALIELFLLGSFNPRGECVRVTPMDRSSWPNKIGYECTQVFWTV